MTSRNKEGLKVSVLIPVFNERWTLREIVRRVYEQSEGLHEILAVDDGSTDGSRERLNELEQKYKGRSCPFRVLYKEKNEGKGAAVAAGLPSITGEVLIIQDADLEYNPKDYAALLAPFKDGRADVVYGSRFAGSENKVLLFWHMVANKILTLLCNFISNLNLTDVWTGYKAFRLNVLRSISLRSRGFGFEPEVTVKIARLGCRIYEVPISYEGRGYGEGKKIGAQDALTGIVAMIAAWLSSRLGGCAGESPVWRLMLRSQRYAQFLFERMSPWVGREVIEIGAGSGSISRMLLDRDRLVLSDDDPGYVMQLSQTYQGWDYIKTMRLDLSRAEEEAARIKEKFDSVVCLHRLEPLEEDEQALKAMWRLLKPGGRLILAVWRGRYDKSDLSRKLGAAGFELETLQFLNPLAVPLWWFKAKICGCKTISNLDLALYDCALFWSRFPLFSDLSFGLSILAVGRKTAG